MGVKLRKLHYYYTTSFYTRKDFTMTFRQAINEILIEQQNKKIAEMEFLSFEELGLYFYIRNLSKTEINAEKLARRGNISVKKCKNLLKTLLEAGLIQAENIKDKEV